MPTQIPIKGNPGPVRRRSQRVLLGLPVTVRTEEGPHGASFKEETQTLVVNAHGALIGLAGRVEQGQILYLTNRVTTEEQQCRVNYVGPVTAGKAQIGVEFMKSSPDFWHITFPPEDWTVPEQVPDTTKVVSGRETPKPSAGKKP